MATSITISDDLRARLERHLEDDQTIEEFIDELLGIYESSRYLQEGYSE